MLYKNYLKMHLKSSFQYRYNMMFITFNQILINISEILAVYLLFSQFNSVAGWTFYQSLLMMGIVYTVFSLTECFARGYDEFPKLIKSGELDRFLIRPVNIHYQIFGSKIEFTKLARVILGIVISIIAIVNINVDWNILKSSCIDFNIYLWNFCYLRTICFKCRHQHIYSWESRIFKHPDKWK